MHYQNGYAYRSIRTPQGPRHEYYGRGVVAELYADLDAANRAKREYLAAKRQDERHRQQTIDAQLDASWRDVRRIVSAILLTNGYRQHKRQWRQRRYTINMTTDAPLTLTNRADIDALLQRVNGSKPLPADLDALRQWLATSPDARLVAISGDQVAHHLLDAHDVGAAAKIIIEDEQRRLRLALESEGNSAIERLIIGQVVLRWTRVMLLERTLTVKTETNHDAEHGLYWARRLDHAQRAYDRALLALARVRSLPVGSLQVNVAHTQQVNNNTP